MEFVSMKLEEPVESTVAEPIEKVSRPKFPYGLRLRFEKEQLEQYPALKLLDVGDKVLLMLMLVLLVSQYLKILMVEDIVLSKSRLRKSLLRRKTQNLLSNYHKLNIEYLEMRIKSNV
jgi:hypothetical protein